MSTGTDRFSELRHILEALCEERATAAQIERLDELALHDPACRRFYLEYIDLHGNLYWDAAQASTEPVAVALPLPARKSSRRRDLIARATDASDETQISRSKPNRRQLSPWTYSAIAIAAGVLIVTGAWATLALRGPTAAQNQIAKATLPSPNAIAPNNPAETHPVAAQDSGPLNKPSSIDHKPEPVAEKHASLPVPLPASIVTHEPRPNSHVESTEKTATRDDRSVEEPAPKDVVAFVDARLHKAWKSAGVEPSQRADDSEWLRRVYLDLVGHIPPEAAVDAFLDEDSEEKRAEVVAQLLASPDYARNWATMWANLLVGRQPRATGVSRDMLEKFLRDSFSTGVPWNEVVYELVSAEGTPAQNPATNFLLAHLNNDAVPATAMTARVFLGIQVQCTQCHDHPFQNDKQSHFWELKSFFQQTEMTSTGRAGQMGGEAAPMAPSSKLPTTGLDGSVAATPSLVTRNVGGPLYYETRRGEMRVAYPVYAGHKIDPGPKVNRRRELARLIAKGDDRQLALAFVNRTWQHFFGYAFTRSVDDMGPHNPASTPEILDRLANEFIASGYDMKLLCRWICTTEAYQRGSSFRTGNRTDDPATGGLPSFSRVYLKPMTAEQLYDSLLVATKAKSSARTDWNDAGRRRQDWVRQFVINYGTDENDEATLPSGSVSQALLMMNDAIVHSALAVEPGTLLYDVAHATTDDTGKIRRLCRAALSRDPKPAELEAALERVQSESEDAKSPKARELAQARALQDVFWAFLNANEFAFVH